MHADMMKNVIRKIKKIYYLSSGQRLLEFYRSKGVKIGDSTTIFNPKDIVIDYTRPELLEIGKHVFLHAGTTILTHDWASWCFVKSHNEFYPSHAKVKIGDNVWLGRNVTICKGVTIGDNCIIGIGSVVTKDIPNNSIAVGVPAKVVGSYEDYMKRRSSDYIDEAIEYAEAILESGREPQVNDFCDDYPCFVDGENYKDYDYPYDVIFSPSQFEVWKKKHHKVFNGFDDFILFVKNRKKNEYCKS